MSELALTRDERLALRARAHHLNPVVLLGAAGLTEAVVKETDRALAAHELIKIRIPGDDREERQTIAMQLAERLGAARVQAIGKLLVLYRPRPEAAPTVPAGAQKPRTQASPNRPRGRPGAPRRSEGPGRRSARRSR